MTKATTPKKIAVKGETPYYDYALVNASGQMNPSAATLTYTAKTGLFKGTFKLYYDGFDAKGALQHKTVSVSYAGVMIPQGNTFIGLGAGTATINKQKVGMPVFLTR